MILNRNMESHAEAMRAIVAGLNTRQGSSSPSRSSSADRSRDRTLTLKPSEIYLFKPTSRQDTKSARIFHQRITDAMLIYKDQEQKLALLLPRYLNNEIAHTWYAALSITEKEHLALSSA